MVTAPVAVTGADQPLGAALCRGLSTGGEVVAIGEVPAPGPELGGAVEYRSADLRLPGEARQALSGGGPGLGLTARGLRLTWRNSSAGSPSGPSRESVHRQHRGCLPRGPRRRRVRPEAPDPHRALPHLSPPHRRLLARPRRAGRDPPAPGGRPLRADQVPGRRDHQALRRPPRGETLTFLYCHFRPREILPEERGRGVGPFTVSWEDTGQAMLHGLRAPAMPSPYEVFLICAGQPHRKYRIDKARRLLQWEAADTWEEMLRRS